MNKQGGPYTYFLTVNQYPSNLSFPPKAINNLSRVPIFSGKIQEVTLTDTHYGDSVMVRRDENNTLLVTDFSISPNKK